MLLRRAAVGLSAFLLSCLLISIGPAAGQTKTSQKKTAAKKTTPRKTAKRKTAVRRKAPAVPARTRANAVQFVNAKLEFTPDDRIENAEALDPFFDRLHRLEAGDLARPASILHFGDSHTASDDWAGTLRTLLQLDFGDGGAGFSHAGRPFRGYRRLDVKSYSSRRWEPAGLLRKDGDGWYGLSGASLETTHPGEAVTLEAVADRVEIHFLRQPGGGRLELFDNASPVGEIGTDGELGLGIYEYQAQPGQHYLELRTLDKAPVRLLGWVTEQASGVTYETLGINGAQASLILGWREEMLEAAIARRDPALIVLAYGTNEAGSRDWTGESYQEMFSTLLQRLRQHAPEAAILVAGPPGRHYRYRGVWRVHPGVDKIVAAQRAAALENGCAFWDLRAKIGGEGAMRQWVLAGLAQYDHVHFTREGYQRLGHALFRDLIGYYRQRGEDRQTILIGDAENGSAIEDP